LRQGISRCVLMKSGLKRGESKREKLQSQLRSVRKRGKEGGICRSTVARKEKHDKPSLTRFMGEDFNRGGREKKCSKPINREKKNWVHLVNSREATVGMAREKWSWKKTNAVRRVNFKRDPKALIYPREENNVNDLCHNQKRGLCSRGLRNAEYPRSK